MSHHSLSFGTKLSLNFEELIRRIFCGCSLGDHLGSSIGEAGPDNDNLFLTLFHCSDYYVPVGGRKIMSSKYVLQFCSIKKANAGTDRSFSGSVVNSAGFTLYCLPCQRKCKRIYNCNQP